MTGLIRRIEKAENGIKRCKRCEWVKVVDENTLYCPFRRCVKEGFESDGKANVKWIEPEL